MTTTAEDSALTQDVNALSEALTDLIRVVQFRDRDRACCFDVSVSQCYALKAVVDRGPLTVNDLAAYLYLDKSTASRIANGLVGLGYLARARDPEDGRIVRLIATPEGEGLYGRITGQLAAEYGEMLADIEPEVRATMTRLLGRLGTALSARVQTTGGSCCVVR